MYAHVILQTQQIECWRECDGRAVHAVLWVLDQSRSARVLVR